MKSKFIFLASCLIILGSIQTSHAGMRANLSLNTASYSQTPVNATSTSGTSIGYGLSYEFGLGPIAIEPGVFLNNYSFTPQTGSDIKSTYLTFPVLARYYFVPFFNVLAGMYYQSGLGISINDVSTTFNSLNSKSSDLGFILGAGAKIPLGVAELFADFRWSRSLSDVDTSAATTTKINLIQFLVGFGFGL